MRMFSQLSLGNEPEGRPSALRELQIQHLQRVRILQDVEVSSEEEWEGK